MATTPRYRWFQDPCPIKDPMVDHEVNCNRFIDTLCWSQGRYRPPLEPPDLNQAQEWFAELIREHFSLLTRHQVLTLDPETSRVTAEDGDDFHTEAGMFSYQLCHQPSGGTLTFLRVEVQVARAGMTWQTYDLRVLQGQLGVDESAKDWINKRLSECQRGLRLKEGIILNCSDGAPLFPGTPTRAELKIKLQSWVKAWSRMSWSKIQAMQDLYLWVVPKVIQDREDLEGRQLALLDRDTDETSIFLRTSYCPLCRSFEGDCGDCPPTHLDSEDEEEEKK